MNECHIETVRFSMPVETRRKLSAAMMGRTFSEESKAKMLKASMNKRSPHTCNRCTSRDVDMCARYNVRCFDAKDTDCFRSYMKRKEHPDYIKKGVKHV